MNISPIPTLFSKLSTLTVAFDKEAYSRIILKGSDAKTFLHNISTNEVISKKTGDSSLNILVSQKGRMVELLHQHIIADDTILLITPHKQSQDLIDWMDQFLFTEEVEIQDVSNQGGLIWWLGPLNFDNYKENFIIIPSFNFVDENNQKISSQLIYHDQKSAAEILKFCAPDEIINDEAIFETLRIAAGIPWYPNEINQLYNPIELGLNVAINWTKGCYIGQEVISRLDTYQKQSKQLCLVNIDGTAFSELQNGQNISIETKDVGVITSVAPIYWANHASAMAIIKQRPEAEFCTEAKISNVKPELPISLTKIST